MNHEIPPSSDKQPSQTLKEILAAKASTPGSRTVLFIAATGLGTWGVIKLYSLLKEKVQLEEDPFVDSLSDLSEQDQLHSQNIDDLAREQIATLSPEEVFTTAETLVQFPSELAEIEMTAEESQFAHGLANRLHGALNYLEPKMIELLRDEKYRKTVLEFFYERYNSPLTKFIRSKVANQMEAENLTSEVFYRMVRRLQDFVDRGGSVKAWLIIIARNLIYNYYDRTLRRSNKSSELNENILSKTRMVDEEVISNLEWETLLSVVETLSKSEQDLLKMVYMGYSNKEIGERLGRTELATRAFRFRTMRKVRRLLEER